MMGRPQQVILDSFPAEKWDIFIGVLWSRFGTPTGAVHPETGQPFQSGTEEEFTLAIRQWQETGRPRPLFYRCMRTVSPSADFEQLGRLEEFFRRFGPEGEYPDLYRSYDSLDEFERMVREDLTYLLLDSVDNK